jgi:hypothetical protein
LDPVRSFAVAAGPDQREAVVALAFHQRGINRGREARIVELDREIFAIALPRGLLPRGAEFRATCEDAPISMSEMIDTPVSINSLVTGKGDGSFTLIWSRRSADWSRGINASPSKRVYIGAGHKAACYSCLRCKPLC